MPPIRDLAVVLRRWDWSETSQATLLFCREHGMLRGLAKGAKRDKGPFSGGLEPLTLGEVGAIVKPSSELATLTDWDLREVFWGARGSSLGFLAGHYIADVIRHGVHDDDPHVSLWDDTVEALRALAATDGAHRGLAQFQWAFLSETGYEPDLTTFARAPEAASSESWKYDPSRGVVARGDDIADGWGIRAETLAFLIGLSQRDPDIQAASAETIERANRFLAACIQWSLGEAPPTMERLFGPVLGAADPTRRPPAPPRA